MFYTKLTYSGLRLIMSQRLGLQGMPPLKSGANADSALSEFLLERGIANEDAIGSVLRSSFPRELAEHLTALRKSGRTMAYIKNRRYLLRYWHTLLRALDHEGAIIDKCPTPLQARLEALMVDRSYREVARAVGMARASLKNWALRGSEPKAGKERHLVALEAFFNLPQGELIDLLPYNAFTRRQGGAKIERHIAYRKRLKELAKDPYKVKPLKALPRLRAQWRGVLEYKAPAQVRATVGVQMTALERHRAAIAVPDEQAEKQWNLRPLDRSVVLTERRWVDVHGEYSCPSAAAAFSSNVSPFCGWAQRKTELGGAGLSPEEAQQLAIFCDLDLMNRYLDWKVERSECTSKAILNFCMFVAMMTHSSTGYLPKHPEIARPGIGAQEWIAMCEAAHAWSYKYRAKLTSHNLYTLCRDPSDPLRTILNAKSPLGAVMLGIRRLDVSQPHTGGTHEAVHSRDCALLAILASSALRARNMRELTWYPDNTGHLRQDPDGGWRIVLPNFNMKNQRGAAKKRGYNRALRPDTWAYIRRYVMDYRKVLGGARPELVFVSATNPSRVWGGLSVRVFVLTRTYFPGCPGFSPHGFRHILATHIIMEGKGSDASVHDAAMALLDYPDTIRESYVHVLEKFADRRLAEATLIAA